MKKTVRIRGVRPLREVARSMGPEIDRRVKRALKEAAKPASSGENMSKRISVSVIEPINAPPREAELFAENQRLRHELAQLRALLNTPETDDFDKGVPLESAHQVYRWGPDHDARKDAFDWFWLIGHLSGKAARSAAEGDDEKARHHIITTAAALRNWFARLTAAEREGG